MSQTEFIVSENLEFWSEIIKQVPNNESLGEHIRKAVIKLNKTK